MKKILAFLLGIIVAVPLGASAVSTQLDWTGTLVRFFAPMHNAALQIPFVVSTSTTQTNIFPRALFTQASSTEFCLIGDSCITSWPSGGGGTWGSITGTLSDQTDLQAALDAKLSTTTAASTYYLQTNPAGYITSAALTPYLSTTTAAATYYPLTNPAGYTSNTGTISGAIGSQQIAFGSSTDEIAGDAGFLFDGTDVRLTGSRGTRFVSTGGNYQVRLSQDSNSWFSIDRPSGNWSGVLINGDVNPAQSAHFAIRQNTSPTKNTQEWQASNGSPMVLINATGSVGLPLLSDGCLELSSGLVTSTGSACGSGSGGISSLNGQTGSSQTFATGTATGIGLSITSAGNTHTFTPTVSSGYTIPLTASTTQWATAHASTTALTPSYIRGLFSNTATGLTYNNTTGVTSLTANYVIPLSASTTAWNNTTNIVTAGSAAWNAAAASTTALTPSYIRGLFSAGAGLSYSSGQFSVSSSSFGTFLNALTAKTTPVDNDMFGLMDSAASNVMKKLSWANLKTAIASWLTSLSGYADGNVLTASSTAATGMEWKAAGGGSNGNTIDVYAGENMNGTLTPKAVFLFNDGKAYLSNATSATSTKFIGFIDENITSAESRYIGGQAGSGDFSIPPGNNRYVVIIASQGKSNAGGISAYTDATLGGISMTLIDRVSLLTAAPMSGSSVFGLAVGSSASTSSPQAISFSGGNSNVTPNVAVLVYDNIDQATPVGNFTNNSSGSGVSSLSTTNTPQSGLSTMITFFSSYPSGSGWTFSSDEILRFSTSSSPMYLVGDQKVYWQQAKAYTASGSSQNKLIIHSVELLSTRTTTTVKINGQVSGFSSLLPGSSYFITSSSTGGVLTTATTTGVRAGKALSTSTILVTH